MHYIYIDKVVQYINVSDIETIEASVFSIMNDGDDYIVRCLKKYPPTFLPRDVAVPARYSPCYVPACVRVCICLSQVGVLLDIGSHKQHHAEAQKLENSAAVAHPAGAPNADGMGKNRRLSTSWLYLENGRR